MNLAEETKEIIDLLPESDLIVIYTVAKNMFDKVSTPFKPLTREQILEDLALSRKQIDEGNYIDMDEALDSIGAKYGF